MKRLPLALLALCLSASFAWAAPSYLQCPYVQIGNVWQVEIEKFTRQIEVERGFTCCPWPEPWAEVEIDVDTPATLDEVDTTPDTAFVYTDVSPALLAEITAQTGCTAFTRPTLQGLLDTGTVRSHRGQALSRAVIPALEARVPTRGAWLLERVRRWLARLPLGPAVAWALGTFPDTNFTLDFNGGAQDPIAGGWDGPFSEAGECQQTAGGAMLCDTDESSHYVARRATGESDVEMTMVTQPSTTNLYLGTTGVPNTSGYAARINTGQDTISVIRYGGGTTYTLIGATCAQLFDAGDRIGVRVATTTVATYFGDEGATPTQLCSRTEETHARVPGFVWLAADAVDGWSFDDLAFTSAPPSRGGIIRY